MANARDDPDGKSAEILRQMREETARKRHLDQQRLRAQAALRRAIEARDESAFVAALTALGIDPASEEGRAHPAGFQRLHGRRY
jgi:hypothetical protein